MNSGRRGAATLPASPVATAPPHRFARSQHAAAYRDELKQLLAPRYRLASPLSGPSRHRRPLSSFSLATAHLDAPGQFAVTDAPPLNCPRA